MKAVLKKVLGLSLVAMTSIAAAQSKFPDGPIKMIVPFAPGGGVDSAARLIAKQMQSNLNVNIVVENKPGANGSVGGKVVQTSPADGNTLLFSASTHVLAKQVMATPPYDPLTDFAYVARVAYTADARMTQADWFVTSGFGAVLIKPIKRFDLLEALDLSPTDQSYQSNIEARSSEA